jgi:hypothetical protein
MKVPKNYDVVSKGSIPCAKGTESSAYKGIQPEESNIKDTPGENATNDTAAHSTNKAQPFGAGGSGYTSKS